MRIQHNIMAMSAYRNYTNNVSAMKKNLEKLSSGYKINRAGDDAAGLAISEKMRAQITGLETAQKNAKDGISLVQTAEGALTEVHDMLNRMVELATQSANGTYDDTTDRYQLQKEMNQLRSEINRIADSSNFNGIKLLDGSMSSKGGGATASDIEITAVADGLRGSGQAAASGVYEIDLSDLALSVVSGAIAATADLATITFAGQTIGTIQLANARLATDTAATLTKADVSFVLKTGLTTMTVGGLEFSIAATGDKITLSGRAAPSEAQVETFNKADLSVGLTLDTTKATGHNNGFDFAVHANTPVAAASTNKLAQGEFKLTDDMIKDGASIKIGDTIYSFKVGANGKGGGGTNIDLSKFEEGSAGLAAEAAKVLSQQTDPLFHIQTVGKDGTVRLTEKDGALNDYKTWDLQGTKGTDGDATWKNLTTGKSVVQFTKAAGANKSLTLQIGDTADSFNQLKVDIEDMHCASLGIDSISIADQASAQSAISAIKTAINKVSDVRGTLGATQNRLDHTINNLSVMTENIQDAESTIRDTDVAEEMMAYTKNNILIQSAQAMLAQANQVPQGVLQLLQ